MASSVNSSCQSIVRCSSRLTRRVSRQRLPARAFSTTKSPQQRPREDEIEELPAGFKMDELSSMAHVELQTHRELRTLARQAAWEMPLLSTLSKAFEPPTLATPLRWRYTTYLGELHPAANKVVVEFCLRDLKDLTDEQKQTMRKLAGARWYSDTDIIKMSCESFDTQAQNKRYLGETIAALIKEAKEGEDKFVDIPLDMRIQAVRAKKKLKRSAGVRFPEDWRMTPERRAALDAIPGRLPAQIEASEVVSENAEEQQAYEAIKEAAINEGEMERQAEPVPVPVQRIVSGVEAIELARQIELAKQERPVAPRVGQPFNKPSMVRR